MITGQCYLKPSNDRALFFCRPKKFTLKGYKRYFFTYRDLHLYLYKSREEARSNSSMPAVSINLKGCEVTPDVILAQGKFSIKLEVPPESGSGANSEVWVRCETVSKTDDMSVVWFCNVAHGFNWFCMVLMLRHRFVKLLCE